MGDDTSSFGYGQEQPQDSASDPNVLAFVFRQLRDQMDTIKVVRVEAVHPGSGNPAGAGTVDVRPLVNQIDGNGYAVPHGTVFGIPVLRLQAGGNAIIVTPVVGEVGLVVCADRDSSVALRTGAAANPGSRRRYNVADGVYVGSLIGVTPTSYIQVSDSGITLQDANGNSITTTSGGIVLSDDHGNMVQMQSGKITLTTATLVISGDLHVAGTVIAGFGGGDQVGLQTHQHPGNNTPPTPGT